MKLSEKMWLMIILKFTKNQEFTLSLEDTFLEKPPGVQTVARPYSSLLTVKQEILIFSIKLL